MCAGGARSYVATITRRSAFWLPDAEQARFEQLPFVATSRHERFAAVVPRVDKSALRPHVPAFADVLIPRIAAGRGAVCLVTELEVGYSARSTKDFESTRDDVIGPLI